VHELEIEADELEDANETLKMEGDSTRSTYEKQLKEAQHRFKNNLSKKPDQDFKS